MTANLRWLPTPAVSGAQSAASPDHLPDSISTATDFAFARVLGRLALTRHLWEAVFSELNEVQAVGSIKGLTTGIRFRTQRQHEWVIFWTSDRPGVVAGLEARGVAVDAVPVRLHLFHPGR